MAAMTDTTTKDQILDTKLELFTRYEALDFDERPDEAEEFAEFAADVISGAASAALRSIRERFPELDVDLRIDGVAVVLR